MLCQHCHKNEAEYHFLVQFGYGGREVHLCAACTVLLGRQYMGAMNSWGFAPTDSKTDLFGAGDRQSRQNGLPPEMAEDFQKRRHIAELKIKLEQAVEAEEYETAASLRDEIRRAERTGGTGQPVGPGSGRQLPIN